MEMKHGTLVSAFQLFLIVSSAQECQNHTVSTQRRLDDIRDVFFLLLIIKVRHILTGYILMLGQVIIGTVCNAPELAPAEGEQELQVRGRLAVEAKLLRRMVARTHLIIA